MTPFSLKNEFVKSLITLKESNERFFYVTLPSNKKLKIKTDFSSCEWVLKYKYSFVKEAVKFKKKYKIDITDQIFSFFFYYFNFVMPDVLMLKNFLPKNISHILDIGAGIGLFELFLHNLYGTNSNISIIEVNRLLEIEHHKKSQQTKKLNKPLKVLDLAKKFLLKNNISNITFIDSKNISNILNVPYDLIISIRSWGFLYELDEYLDFVDSNLASNGTVITDINKRTQCRSKFEKSFINTRVIHDYEAHYRLIGNKK